MLKCWPLTQSCWGKPDRPEDETGELSLITGDWKKMVHGKETVVEYYEIKTQTLVQKRGKQTFKTKKSQLLTLKNANANLWWVSRWWGSLEIEQMGKESTLNITWCLSLLTEVHWVCSESEVLHSPGSPLSSFAMFDSPLSSSGTPWPLWEHWALLAKPPCWQLLPMARHHHLALYPETDRENTSPTEVSMGTFHHRRAQVTMVVWDR